MENISIGGVFLTTILDTRRPKQSESRKSKESDCEPAKKSDLYPVKYRITFQRKQVYYPAGIDLTPNEWDYLYHKETWEQNNKPKIRPVKDLKEFGTLIHSGYRKVEKHIKVMVEEDTFTWEALSARIKKGSNTSLLSTFESRIEDLKQNNQHGNASWYQCTVNSIKTFTSKDIKLSAVTPDWLHRYEQHLLEKGKSYTTISMYMRALRAILNDSIRQGNLTLSQYPFGKDKYPIPTAKGRKMALKVAQIKQILDYPLTLDIDQRYRDLWFFSYLCNGININDLLRLKYSDIENGEIHYHRLKTINTSRDKTEIIAILLPQMERIIERWGTKGEYIFEGIENATTPVEERRLIQNITRAINFRMAKIGKALGIGTISTYTARHSFATVLKRSGASIAFISESLGHRDMKTTAAYLDSFEKEERAKNAANLVNFEQ